MLRHYKENGTAHRGKVFRTPYSPNPFPVFRFVRSRPAMARKSAMNLSDWRRRIDEIDKKLVELLNERSRCALEIGKLKQVAKIPLYQPDRENEVIQNAERNNAGPLTDAAIRRLFERIIDEARAAERDAMHSGDSHGKGGNE